PMVGTIGVTLAKRYVPPSEIDSHVGVNCGGIEVDWATAAPRFEKDWQKVDLRGAVVVLSVATNSSAWEAGLREGDFISEVGGESVRFPDEFAATWEKAADSIELKVNSGPNQSSRILRFPKIVASEK
ncbi:MAG: PDZ domain-containing protein, partial [Planctomycetota bacterium]|nr:PDZ domain-containing protein [Planctomycetota bacterium]